jgi:curved DNA-binding protein CbpA
MEVAVDCDFRDLRKAYFKKAKACHPDRHGGAKNKEEEFKLLVDAFDTLSDPIRRKRHDIALGIATDDTGAFAAVEDYSIMDSPAADTLEEIIVGNNPPRNATLATLFRDLESTEVFMTFREGKNLYYKRKMSAAMALFRKAVDHTPNNILYRFFLARTCAAAGLRKEAVTHYRKAVEIGQSRIPQQKLERVKRELETLQKRGKPWWTAIANAFSGAMPDGNLFANPEEEMVDEANRAIAHILANDRRKRKRLKE